MKIAITPEATANGVARQHYVTWWTGRSSHKAVSAHCAERRLPIGGKSGPDTLTHVAPEEHFETTIQTTSGQNTTLAMLKKGRSVSLGLRRYERNKPST